jgi:hypothetical protein
MDDVTTLSKSAENIQYISPLIRVS